MRMDSRLARLLLGALAVGGMLLASCAPTPSAPATSGASATSTKPYGSLTIVGDLAPGVLDPTDSGNTSSFRAFGAAIFDSLVELDAQRGSQGRG